MRVQVAAELPRTGSASLAGLLTWMLPVAAVLVPLASSSAFVDSVELPKLCLLKLGLGLALVLLASRASVDLRLLRVPIARAALLFLGVNVLATITSVEPRTSLMGKYQQDQGLLSLGVMIGYLFLAASWVRTEAAFARVALGFGLAASLASIYAIGQQFGLDPLSTSALIDDNRLATAMFGHPNSLGEFLALTIPITAWRSRGLERDLSLWGLGAQLVALFLTQARTAWLVVLVQLLLVGPPRLYKL